jgi:hypothetical protein
MTTRLLNSMMDLTTDKKFGFYRYGFKINRS